MDITTPVTYFEKREDNDRSSLTVTGTMDIRESQSPTAETLASSSSSTSDEKPTDIKVAVIGDTTDIITLPTSEEKPTNIKGSTISGENQKPDSTRRQRRFRIAAVISIYFASLAFVSLISYPHCAEATHTHTETHTYRHMDIS